MKWNEHYHFFIWPWQVTHRIQYILKNRHEWGYNSTIWTIWRNGSTFLIVSTLQRLQDCRNWRNSNGGILLVLVAWQNNGCPLTHCVSNTRNSSLFLGNKLKNTSCNVICQRICNIIEEATIIIKSNIQFFKIANTLRTIIGLCITTPQRHKLQAWRENFNNTYCLKFFFL